MRRYDTMVEENSIEGKEESKGTEKREEKEENRERMKDNRPRSVAKKVNQKATSMTIRSKRTDTDIT